MASVAQDIGAGAVTRITALALTDATVVERATMVVLETDTLPLIVVTVTENRFDPATADAALAWFGFYTLNATIVQRKTGVMPDQTLREWAQRIRRKLCQPGWAEAAAVDDVDPARFRLSDAAKLDKAYSYYPTAFTVRTKEART